MRQENTAEQRILFSAAHVLFLALMVAAIVAIVIDVAAICLNRPASESPRQAVAATDVLAKISNVESTYDMLTSPSASAQVPNAAGLTMPDSLNSVLVNNDVGAAALNNWLNQIPRFERQGFVSGLTKVVVLANQHAAKWEWDNRQRYVAAAMNQYAHTTIDDVTQWENVQAASAQSRQSYVISAFVLLCVIAVLTLVLLLLAIERNTRPRIPPP